MNKTISPQGVLNPLTLNYAALMANQRVKGATFNPTFNDYVEVVHRNPAALQSIIERYVERKRITNIMHNFCSGYVLSWMLPEAQAAGFMDKTKAKYMGAQASPEMFKLKKGERHTDGSCDLIRRARLGTKATDTTRSKMSDSHTGVKKSEESKQRARESALRNAAARRPAQIATT